MRFISRRLHKFPKLLWTLQKNELLSCCARSYWRASTTPDLFGHVRKYCFFVGYPRSGHTLLGSLLNAHPKAVVCHELHAANYLDLVPNRKWFFAMHLGADARFAKKGRRWTGYDYRVPGQSHGCFEQIEVVGDKRGGGAAIRLAGDLDLLTELRLLVGVPIRVIHQVRNPFDNIATTAKRRDFSLDQAIDVFESFLEKNRRVLSELSKNEWLLTRHEDLIENPKAELARIVRFLDLEPAPDYIEACASIVFKSPTRPRFEWEWSGSQIERVLKLIASSPYHEDYSYEERED